VRDGSENPFSQFEFPLWKYRNKKKDVTNSPTLVVTPNKTSMQEGISGKIANFSSTQN
jgi:hypothetical protein